MAKAVWNGAVLAESDACRIIEGNHYFPLASVRREHLRASETHTVCGWKGVASYYDVVVNGAVNKDAGWYYPNPKPAAREVKDSVAFWRGVEIEP